MGGNVMRIFYGFRIAFYVIRFVFRFFSGRPLSGDRKTDSTFTRPATRSLDPSHTALRWEMMRGASRAAWRCGGLYLLLLAVCLLLLKASSVFVSLPWVLRPSSVLLMHLLLIGGAIAFYLIRRRCVEYGYSVPTLRREESEEGGKELKFEWVKVEGRRAWLNGKVLPVSRAASIILTTPIPDRKATEWVTVPKNYREPGGAPIEIRLPSSFTGADEGVKKRLTSSVREKLGMRSIEASWQTEGEFPRVIFRAPPEPPALVSFSDVRRYLEAMGEWDFLYGVIGTGEIFSISITGDTPHGAVSAGSNGGKSELLKGKIMQAGHKGWWSLILDWKEESQEWAKGLHGIRYKTALADIHDACIQVGEEIEWRKSNQGAPRPKLLVVLEEWNITSALLTDYWSAMRSTADPEERRTMPARSPAVTSVMKAIFTGRSLGVFVDIVAIRFSARVTNGNADLRESFQVINLAKYKPQTVKMLAPDVKPFPRKSTHPGRWVAVVGDEAVIYQAPLYTDQEAREWHQSGEPFPASPWSERFGTSFAQQVHVDLTQGDQLRLDATRSLAASAVLEGEVLTDVDARKLSDMVDGLAPLGVTWNVLRNSARDDERGDPTFPKAYGGSPNKGYTYDYAAVREWARKRHASQETERNART
jgi:hypothetical protein